jgi:hypothetical protein
MRPTIIFLILFIAACSRTKDKFNYDSNIASVTYEAEMKYIDARLFFYKTLSEKGSYYNKENEFLEKITSDLKERIRKREQITPKEQKDFLNHFEETFHQSVYVDFDKYNELKNIPIRTLADIDLIAKYIKSCFFYILNDNKLLPFDSYGPLVCSDKWTIKDGEAFAYRLSVHASSRSVPFQWYLVKDANKRLIKENIIDTLKADEWGQVYAETNKYIKGKNVLHIILRLTESKGDEDLSTDVIFFVK